MRIWLLSAAFLVSAVTVSFGQDAQNPDQVKTLEAKIARLHAELTAIKQQMTMVAESKQDDVPPPPPAPSVTVVTTNQPIPAQLPAPVYVEAVPVQPYLQAPYLQTPYLQAPYLQAPYYQQPYYSPNYCPYGGNAGYGYGGVGFSVGGVDFGFYPSFGY